MILQKLLMLLVVAGVAGIMLGRRMRKGSSAAPIARAPAGGDRRWPSLRRHAFSIGWPEVSAAALVIMLLTEHT
jgi:hypothetical protein